MEEIAAGVFHWTTSYEKIRSRVRFYYPDSPHGAFLLDPRITDEGLAWFEQHFRPSNMFAFGDALIREALPGELAFISDSRMGEDPEPAKHGLKKIVARLSHY